jgi:hypothetical protein
MSFRCTASGIHIIGYSLELLERFELFRQIHGYIRSKAAAHSFAALANLLGQGFSNGVVDFSFVQIQENRFGQLRYTAANKRLGKPSVFGQLFEIRRRDFAR